MDEILTALRAAGESTRLRILVALRGTELSVGELCRVLDQSQPRVSRHLRILHDARLVDRSNEGTSAYFRRPDSTYSRELLDLVLTRVDLDDPQITADDAEVAAIRAERAASSAAYFERIASDWDEIRPLHVADAEVEAALLAALGDRRPHTMLDIGTGTGRMLELFAPHVDRAMGVDLSQAMLRAARGHLDHAAARHCVVRRGDALDLDLMTGSTDLVVLHHVLHFLEEPETAIREAARVLEPGGLLLIVDFGRHDVETLRNSHAHRHLGFDSRQIEAMTTRAGLEVDAVDDFLPTPSTAIATHLWRAVAPVMHPPSPTRSSR